MTTTITQEHRMRMQEGKRLSLNVSQLIQEARLDVGPSQEAAIARRLSGYAGNLPPHLPSRHAGPLPVGRRQGVLHGMRRMGP